MCTVSVVPTPSGYRMVCNRDEQRTRPIGFPPRVHLTAGVAALWPTDPLSGGTWIAVNDAGLAFALLNRTAAATRRPSSGAMSRGTIIPQLVGSRSLAATIERTLSLGVSDVGSFTLLVVERTTYGWVTSLDGRISLRSAPLRSPVLLTSSSLGDDVVELPRAVLFRQLVACHPRPLEGQAAFHSHRWPSRPDISVHMSRAEASTVSRTVVDVTHDRVSVRYTPLHQ